MSEPFKMPVMSRGDGQEYFTWVPTAAHREQAKFNHGQTLERLRERGGVDWMELYWILKGLGWGANKATAENEDICKRWCLKVYPQ